MFPGRSLEADEENGGEPSYYPELPGHYLGKWTVRRGEGRRRGGRRRVRGKTDMEGRQDSGGNGEEERKGQGERIVYVSDSTPEGWVRNEG